jgi:hypothetical protein
MQTLTELSFIEHLKGLLLMLKGPSQLEKKKKEFSIPFLFFIVCDFNLLFTFNEPLEIKF